MKITVFGASGKVGRLVVDKLLAAGHNVTVFVHASNAFTETKQLKIVKGDVHHAPSVAAAISGSDAVISTLGSWGSPQKDVLSAAMRFAIPAMEEQGVQRIITLTGSAARAPGDVTTLGSKLSTKAFSLVAKPILQDGEEHLRSLAASNLAWTTLRAGIMKDGAASNYTLNKKLPGLIETVTRETVAQAIVDQLDSKTFINQAPHLHG